MYLIQCKHLQNLTTRTNDNDHRHSTKVIFPVLDTAMKLDLQNLTNPPTNLSPPALYALLLLATVDLTQTADDFGDHTPSSGAEFRFSLMNGLDIWLIKQFWSPRGFLTNGQMMMMIAGLLAYMVDDKHPQAVQFNLLWGENNVFLGHGKVGNLWNADVSPDTTASS